MANRKFYLDRGAQFDVQDITGVMAEPPIARSAYALLLPQFDAECPDGSTVDLDDLRNRPLRIVFAPGDVQAAPTAPPSTT